MSRFTKYPIVNIMLLAAAGIFTTGCGSGPKRAGPVDVELAHESLRAVLESWKNGEPINTLRDASPAITVQDFDWKTGFALLQYEIQGDDKEDSANLHCPVQLILRDPQGREVKKKVTYVIGTDPIITVFREMSL